MEYIMIFIDLVGGLKLKTILVLIAADLLLGIILAFKNKEFSFQKLANFLMTDVFYYMGGYFVVGILGTIMPEFVQIVNVAAAAIVVTLTSFVLEKLKKLGLPIPERLTN